MKDLWSKIKPKLIEQRYWIGLTVCGCAMASILDFQTWRGLAVMLLWLIATALMVAENIRSFVDGMATGKRIWQDVPQEITFVLQQNQAEDEKQILH